jgi:hypothetical protein
MVDGEVLYHYGIQVRVRSVDHPSGFLKAEGLRHWMAEVLYAASVAVPPTNNKYVLWCLSRIGQVLPLGRDTGNTGRKLFTINCTAAIIAA